MGIGGRVVGAMLVVGAGALTVAAIVAGPKLLRAARPATREAIRSGLQVYARVREAAAALAEDFEDIVAEVQSEMKDKRDPEAPPPAAKEA